MFLLYIYYVLLQLNINFLQVISYYVLGFCRWKLNKVEDAFEAVTAAKNCIEELSLLKISPGNYSKLSINFRSLLMY